MFQSLENNLNQYAKKLLKLMYQEYKDFFGQEDDLLLFRMLEEKIIVVDFSNSDSFLWIDENLKRILIHPTLVSEKREEEVFSFFQSYLPFSLHSFFIQPKGAYDEEFSSFFSKGLTECFARAFSLKYQIPYTFQNDANSIFALNFLNQVPKELRGYKEKMVFQNDISYMCDVYQIHTGRNLFKKFKQEYIKQEEFSNLVAFLTKHLPSFDKEFYQRLVSIGTYAGVSQELTNVLYEKLQNKPMDFSLAMEELSNLFANFSYAKREVSALERKQKNGYLKTIVILFASLLFGVFLSFLILQ